jgi:hypothetical protein
MRRTFLEVTRKRSARVRLMLHAAYFRMRQEDN